MATYNPYNDAYSIYKLKNSWHEADAKGDTATKDKSAKEAQAYYQSLIKNGYSDIAEKLQKTDNKGAKDVIKNLISSVQQPTGDEWYQNNLKEFQSNPEWTDGVKTGSSTGVQTVKSTMPEAKDTETITGKINDLYGIQRSDRETMAGKYDTLEDYNYNHNPYESEIGKSIMEDYKFKGKTASDNAVASGGASNGGNIDSYASANANRQQMAFTNAGKQAVLADFNTRIANARGILSDLGVYQQNQDKGMQTTINQQQTEEQRQFENEETKNNNEVDRGVKISEVTGYVPDSFVSANNPFFDKDGNLIDVKNTDYSLIIHNAEEKLKTETDPKKRADLEATIKYAKQARVVKTNMPEYSKYRNTLELYSPDETFTSKVTNKQLDNDKAVEDKKLELTEEEIKANERMNSSTNATNLAIADKELNAKLAEAEEDVTWEKELKKYDLSDDAKNFLVLEGAYDAFENGEKINVVTLLKNNKDKYKLTLRDASEIAIMYNFSEDEKNWIKEQNWYDKDNVDINNILNELK